MRTKTLTAFVIVFMTLTGCASWVSVEPVTASSQKVKGLRYSLATPYLLMKPKADGTVTYEWLFLPDQSKQYAITKHSMLSTSSLEITLEHGTLKKIIGKPNSSAVASTALAQAATVMAAEDTERKKAAEAKETAAKAEQDKLKTAVAAAEAAQRTTVTALDKAKAKREFFANQKPVDDKALAEADLALKMAEIDLKVAEAELARVKASLTATGSTNGGANTADAQLGLGHLRPLLFRVVQHAGGGVTLQAVNDPAKFPDYSQVTSASGGQASIKFKVSEVTASSFALKATQEIELVKDRLKLNKGAAVVTRKITVEPDKTSKVWKLSFDTPLDAGDYAMQFEYKLGEKAQTGSTSFSVK